MERHGKLLPLAFALAAMGVAGCGRSTELVVPAPGCSPGSAAIGVTDGMVAILCGCDEAVGWVANSANLQCTVPSGTTVAFHYINPVYRHQIVSKPTETDTFTPSTVYDREATPVIRAHAVTLTGAPGREFEFTDQFDSSLSARITLR
jgi:hypothetical protein